MCLTERVCVCVGGSGKECEHTRECVCVREREGVHRRGRMRKYLEIAESLSHGHSRGLQEGLSLSCSSLNGLLRRKTPLTRK